MTRNRRRLALSYRALLTAALVAGASTPAFAADTVLDIPAGGSTFFVTASPAAGDTYTVNNLGTVGINFAGFTAVSGSGAGTVVINNGGILWGPLNFGAATGPVTFNNNSGITGANLGWRGQGNTTFGSGNDRVINAETGLIRFTGASSFAFNGGNDSLENQGRFVGDTLTFTGLETIDNSGVLGFSTLTITGMQTFDNSGAIVLGVAGSFSERSVVESDGLADDRLIAHGVAFTGSGDSRIELDANLAGVVQASCATITAADCIDFTGGSTSGSTLLTVRQTHLSGGPALNAGMTVIMGSSAAGDFILDPASEGYAQSSVGGVIRRGPVSYHLAYDDAADRHQLVGILADEMVQTASFAASAQETWRAATGTWLTRQADLRATPGGFEPSNGLWARAGFSTGERELALSTTQSGTSYDYDADHTQRIAHLMFGADVLVGATPTTAWVVGGMLGLVRSDVAYDLAPTEVVSTGIVGGLYASYVAGPLFVDGVLSAGRMDMIAEMNGMGLGPGVNITQDYNSVGGQVEAGWRIGMDGGMFIEPLVGASYVKTEFEDIELPGGTGTLDFEDSYTSTRFGAGLRGGMATQLMGQAASFSLTGRYWSESDGESATTIQVANGDTATPVIDDFGGGFAELGANLSLYNSDGGVSGFVNLGGKFADDYRSVDAAVGVRMRW